jgi:protein tyrosine phosphatase (PTP) superfamily phosphohydrolase (DUF442 family)
MKLAVTAMCAFWLAAFALAAAEPKKSSPGATPIEDPPGLHNLYLLGTNLYSGSTPEGDAGFEGLAKLGVKTIISVDGAQPEVARAKRFGLRYVHLPHGYDGISWNVQLQLAKAATELEGPFYVHCHHGQHRGPTAAAIICMTKDSWDTGQAEQWLKAAGTATNYSGLYETVRKFKKPPLEQVKALHTEFPEVANVSGLVDSMVQIDNTWDRLKAIRTLQYETSKIHPEAHPPNEAILLWEHFREAQRLPEATKYGYDFIQRLKSAEDEVQTAEQLLREIAAKPNADLRTRLNASFDEIGKSCASCHKDYRN